jgi:hypothetical protein
MKTAICILILALGAVAQTTTTGPTYFSTTGLRASYYDRTLTETTNFGVRVTAANSTTTGQTLPAQGLWAVMSIDATPRSQASSAALRIGARYFLKAAANGNLIFHANAQAGAASVPVSSTTSSLLANIQGGMGVTWRVCHTLSKTSPVNCIADFNYDINSVSSQAVKPLVGIFVGLAF